ncbi:hypothetical protein K376_07005 [Streptomyces sp. PsTaAH-130]|nr:hypothetical protein K376_07005 [Streptomyces sp. PsTaAH-130]
MSIESVRVWWVSGWENVPPRQGFPLTMMIGRTPAC